MRSFNRNKYPQDLPYCLSSDQSDPTCEFAKKDGWLSPKKLFGYAYSSASSSDSLEKDAEAARHDHMSIRKRTFPFYTSRIYVRFFRLVVALTFGCLTAIVIYQSIWPNVRPDPFDQLFPLRYNQPDPNEIASEDRFHAYMRNVLPIRCHSHNDYWRRTPLYAAIGSGCISVEADVWSFDDQLYVGHTRHGLTEENTLASMYLAPIQRLLELANVDPKIGRSSKTMDLEAPRGIFSIAPEQPLILLIDFKTEPAETYEKVYHALSDLRSGGWLTHWNGTARIERQLTIVISGNVPFEQINANTTYRDMFADAPLGNLVDPADRPLPSSTVQPTKGKEPEEAPRTITDLPAVIDPATLAYKYNPSNSYYASMDIKGVTGILNQFSITTGNIATLRQQIHEARTRGLVPRYWGAPRWPRNFRDYTWGLLMENEIGVLNVDDLRAARKGNWGHWTDCGTAAA